MSPKRSLSAGRKLVYRILFTLAFGGTLLGAVCLSALAMGIGGIATRLDNEALCRVYVNGSAQLTRAACDTHGTEHAFVVFAVMLWVVWLALAGLTVAAMRVRAGQARGRHQR